MVSSIKSSKFYKDVEFYVNNSYNNNVPIKSRKKLSHNMKLIEEKLFLITDITKITELNLLLKIIKNGLDNSLYNKTFPSNCISIINKLIKMVDGELYCADEDYSFAHCYNEQAILYFYVLFCILVQNNNLIKDNTLCKMIDNFILELFEIDKLLY